MKIKITATLFALTTFTLLAQPALPTTNSYIVPIANPYSGSWIYYTTNAASGLDFLNGASIPYVMAASNSLASLTAGATNALATTNYVNAATNGLVTASVTNGLAAISYVQSATNGFVTAAITNGLATVSYVNAATNGLVTATITNGLATTTFVTGQGFVTSSVTNGLASISYVNTATNGFVTSSVTNGLASIGYVNTTALSAGAGGNTDGQSLTNLQNMTWGTTTNKPGGAGAPATVYYYFTNGYPMFGIISTNN